MYVKASIPNANEDLTAADMNHDITHRTSHNASSGAPSTGLGGLTRQTTIVGNAAGPIMSNPALSSAMEVCSSLSDVGKAIPFVAPVFILLKIIIDIEQRAQEVDAKCTDLLERITFMVSHLPVLKKMVNGADSSSSLTDIATVGGVDPSSLQAIKGVIDRMNEAVKGAAALISAYRKQSPIARRLSISNRDKFANCAEALNSCCSDLLMSLQIRQSQQLDILTRAVPVDDDDKAAMTFVNAHGGDFEAVQYDRALVKEFAEERHMEMDDSVMGQLEDDVVSEAVVQVSTRLETIVKDNLSTAIVDGIKELAAQLQGSVEQEQSFVCVQCEVNFTRSSNHANACSFHKAEYNTWSKNFPCCDTAHPCQYSSHREKHHCDYPYGTFFSRVRNITNYIDTVDEWASVTDTSLEDDNEEQKASVGKLLRWVSRGATLSEPVILISVGSVWWKEPYYFNTFTLPSLQNIAKSVRHSRRTLIFRTATSETADSYASAEWLLSVSGKITGVRLTAKSRTSTTPFVRVCPIDLSTGQKSGDVLSLSDGGIRSYTPASPYVLPAPVRIGPVLTDVPVRAVRKDFKTRTSTAGFKVLLRSMNEPPLMANPDGRNGKVDFMVGTVSVFNNNAPGSNLPVTIASARASYRLVGDKEYQDLPVTAGGAEGAFKVLGGAQFPVTIDPRQSVNLKFEAAIPRTEEDVKKDVRWWNRAFCARHRPLRVKFIVEDMEGEEASLVLEYVFKPFPFDKAKEDEDVAVFWFDEPDFMSRNLLRVGKASSDDEVLKFDGNYIKVKQLERVVYQALKSGQTEVDVGIGGQKGETEWTWKVWALVDISCRRVYAFKVLLQEGKLVPDDQKRFGCLGYVLCPEYGEVVKGKTRPISFATEVVKFPPPSGLKPYVPPEYPSDDKVDDFKPPVPPKLNRALSVGSNLPPSSLGAGVPLQVPEDLNRRLASLDMNLGRIADALEHLVGVLHARQ